VTNVSPSFTEIAVLVVITGASFAGTILTRSVDCVVERPSVTVMLKVS
jgi:hypothetical protein